MNTTLHGFNAVGSLEVAVDSNQPVRLDVQADATRQTLHSFDYARACHHDDLDIPRYCIPPIVFIQSGEDPLDVEAPFVVVRVEKKRFKGDLDFGSPAMIVDCCLGVSDAVPTHVSATILNHPAVRHGSDSVDGKVVGVAQVAKSVQYDLETIVEKKRASRIMVDVKSFSSSRSKQRTAMYNALSSMARRTSVRSVGGFPGNGSAWMRSPMVSPFTQMSPFRIQSIPIGSVARSTLARLTSSDQPGIDSTVRLKRRPTILVEDGISIPHCVAARL